MENYNLYSSTLETKKNIAWYSEEFTFVHKNPSVEKSPRQTHPQRPRAITAFCLKRTRQKGLRFNGPAVQCFTSFSEPRTKRKARSKHHKVLPQVRAMYKEVWGEDAEILTSKHTARSRSGTMEAQDKEVHLNIAMFTPMAMIPTSVVIAYFVWGIKRLRREVRKMWPRTAENLIALWAFTFSVIREGCCRLVRHDGARFSFMINPSSQAPFLHCMFTAEFRQELDTQWKMMFSSRTRPQWMRTSDVNCASVIEVLLFPTVAYSWEGLQPHPTLAFSVLQQFSKMVDRMGKATKQDLLGENIKYKNKQMFSESLERRKTKLC